MATQESKTQTPTQLGSAGRQLCEPLPFLAPEEEQKSPRFAATSRTMADTPPFLSLQNKEIAWEGLS